MKCLLLFQKRSGNISPLNLFADERALVFFYILLQCLPFHDIAAACVESLDLV